MAHERLELACMRHTRLRLGYLDEAGAPCKAEALPMDVVTRDGAEWLCFVTATDGERLWVRLDRLLSVESL